MIHPGPAATRAPSSVAAFASRQTPALDPKSKVCLEKVDHFRHPIWFNQMHSTLTILTVAALDLDHDLVVSRVEFEATSTALPMYTELYSNLPPLPSASLDYEFATLDKDGSSTLSVSEMNAFVTVSIKVF